MRDDCSCPVPECVVEGTCNVCDVTGGHMLRCPTLAKKEKPAGA